jgi:hypothetical protein
MTKNTVKIARARAGEQRVEPPGFYRAIFMSAAGSRNENPTSDRAEKF